jgi:hypothetical protein
MVDKVRYFIDAIIFTVYLKLLVYRFSCLQLYVTQEAFGKSNVFIDEDIFELSICKFKDSFGKHANAFLPLNAETTKLSRQCLGDANRIARLNTFSLRVKPIIILARSCLQLAYDTFNDGLKLFDPEDLVGQLYFDRTGFDSTSTSRSDPVVSRSETLALFIAVLNTVCTHALPLAFKATQPLVNKVLNFKKFDSAEVFLTLFGVHVKVTQTTGTEVTSTSTLQVYFYFKFNF